MSTSKIVDMDGVSNLNGAECIEKAKILFLK
jgi:hypothetical protein